MDNLQDQFHAPLVELYVCGICIFLMRKRKLSVMQKHLYHSSGRKYLYDVCGNIISGHEIISLSFKRLSPFFERFGMQMLSRVGHTLVLSNSPSASLLPCPYHISLYLPGGCWIIQIPNIEKTRCLELWCDHTHWVTLGNSCPRFSDFFLVGIPFFLHNHCSQESHPLVLQLISRALVPSLLIFPRYVPHSSQPNGILTCCLQSWEAWLLS